MTSFPLQLTTTQKDALDDIDEEIKQFDWEIGEYLFHDFTAYFQLPQIIRISQPWDTTFTKNDILYLHSIYDRHLILSKSLLPDNRTFIIPDWFQGQCRILSSNPIYKSRWWEFHNVLELFRFQMPREHIRLLRDTPVLLLLPTNQTVSVVLKENTVVTLKRIEKSSTITAGKQMFVLTDKNDQEFLLEANQTNAFHFAIKILDNEFDKTYHKDTTEGSFLLPEIIMRYELPLDIEIISLTNTIPIDNFPIKLRLEKYSIAKSVVAFSITDPNHPRILEFSSHTQFSVHCIKCLTTGLPRDSSVYEGPRTFDENAYHQYENVRERLVNLFDDVSIQYMRTPFVGNEEEIQCIGKVHDIGLQIKNEAKNQTYIVLDPNNSSQYESTETLPTMDKHPSRFTVHLPTDMDSPYRNVMEIDENDDEEHEIQPLANT